MAAEIQAEIRRLLEMRNNLDKKVDHLTNALKYLEAVSEESDEPIAEPPFLTAAEDHGFTNKIRAVFRANPTRLLTPISIRDLLVERDSKLDPKIALIHTHNTLKRLVKQNEIVEVQMSDGRAGYRVKPVDLLAALKSSLYKDKEEAIRKAREEATE